jgi:hypothetical protein
MLHPLADDAWINSLLSEQWDVGDIWVVHITLPFPGDGSCQVHSQFSGLCSVRFWRSRLRLKRDGTRAENRFRLSPKRTSPFKSAGASVQSTAGSRGVHISVSNAGYTTFWGSVRVLVTHSIRQFPLHFPSRASPCAIRFQTYSIYQIQVSRPVLTVIFS